MDPLSIIASTITLVSAGGAVGRGLRKLKSLKNAPEELLKLDEDINELYLLIRTIRDLPSPILQQNLVCAALKKAKKAVLEVERLIEYGLSKASSTLSSIKVDSWQWLLAEDKIRRSGLDLQDARLAILTAVSLMHLTSTCVIESRLGELNSCTQETQAQLQIALQAMERKNFQGQIQPEVMAPNIPSSTRMLEGGFARRSMQDNPQRTSMSRSIRGKSTMSLVEDTVPYDMPVTRRIENLTQSHAAVRHQEEYQTTIKLELLLRVLRIQPRDADLFIAAKTGQIKRVQEFLDDGSGSIFDVSEDGDTALQVSYPTPVARYDVVMLLLQLGSDRFQENNVGVSPYTEYWLPHLVGGNGDPDNQCLGSLDFTKFDFTDLIFRVLQRHRASIESILREIPRSDIDATDRWGHTALTFAASFGDADIVRKLISKGASHRIRNIEGVTALMSAVYCDQSECVQLLLDNGADPNEVDSKGNAAVLSWDMDIGDLSILESLYRSGADITVSTDQKQTLLHLLVMQASDSDFEAHGTTILTWLLERKLDINAHDAHGQTPARLAVKRHKPQMLKALLLRGAEYAGWKADGVEWSLVRDAAQFGNIGTLQILQEARLVDTNLLAGDVSGFTAMDLAVWRRDHNEEWARCFVVDPDPDPKDWHNAFKALYVSIAAPQRRVTTQEFEIIWELKYGEIWDKWIEYRGSEGDLTEIEAYSVFLGLYYKA
ncbi:hypothetical protein MMC13_008036 [Lambiella insularis]|nr:hypothetical protein [Lambiella insularis]